jgi:glycosyltransferase involved in cell wall biosynthesis
MFPKLTVIVPTIERPDTLYWTLRTVLEQDYANFSVIVSDNASQDNTAEVVAGFSDPRITYINPGKRLSMARHWEFALTHVSEGYVTVLGDDDGLLPGALQKAGALIAQHQLPALGWRFGNYNWPGLSPYFMIPMSNYYRVVDSRKEIAQVFEQGIIRSMQFPSLYGGFISIDLINELKQQFGGQFFHSRIPDFFSGAAVAASVPTYLRLEFPLSLNATSKHSTGYAFVNTSFNTKAGNDMQHSNDNPPFHEKLVFLKTINTAIAEALLQVHDQIPSFPALSIERVIEETAREISYTDSEAKYRDIMEGLKETGRKNNLATFAENTIAKYPHQPVLNPPVKNKYSVISETVYIDTTGLNIRHVYDACRVAGDTIIKGTFRLQSPIRQYFSKVQQTLRYIYLRLFRFPRLRA